MKAANPAKLKDANCSLDGTDLREMLNAGTQWLEKSAPSIDALNVFPVPDGDTGTNMLLTMRAALEEAYRSDDHGAAGISRALAKGALMGARGNSGVILSQILRGLSESLRRKESFNGKELAAALVQASKAAYKSLSRPVEGTILTVAKDLSASARTAAGKNGRDPVPVLEAAVKTAYDSVANTPNLLKVLKEAGVVDAGGQGLYTLLEGSLRYLKGEQSEMEYRKPEIVTSSMPLAPKAPKAAAGEKAYGYCTEFLLQGEKLDVNRIRKQLDGRGQSVMVVGEGNTVHVHIHTLDPGSILHYASARGTLHSIKIQNMDDQHEDFIEVRRETALPAASIATVAVAIGEGMVEVFKSLGVTSVVSGGKTMNPSAQELLSAIQAAGSDDVVLLPNNANIILNAKQVQSLTEKRVCVVPTTTMVQGIAALLALNYDADLPTNIAAMEKARLTTTTIEITRSIRSGKFGKLTVTKGHYIALLDGEIAVDSTSPEKCLWQALTQKTDLKEKHVVTVYYQDSRKKRRLEKLASDLKKQHLDLEIEMVSGGQPNYDYIASVE